MEFITILGLVAGICTTCAFIPQAVKSYKTRHTKDLSLVMLLILAVGISLWLIYGIIKKDLPIILANSVTLCLALFIITLKLKYK